MSHIKTYKKFFENADVEDTSGSLDPNDIVPIPGTIRNYQTRDGILKIFFHGSDYPSFKFDGDILFIDLSKIKGILEERWFKFVELSSLYDSSTQYYGILEVNDAKILYAVAAESRTYYPRTNLKYSGTGCSTIRKGTRYPMLGVLLVSDLPKICNEADIPIVINSGVVIYDYHDTMSVQRSTNFVSKSAILITDNSRDNCLECNGNRRYMCPDCKGNCSFKCEKCNNGKIRCETCEGAAKLEGGTECFECDDGRVYCEFCKGGGRIKCDTCGGNGQLKCKSCNGEGKIVVTGVLPLKK